MLKSTMAASRVRRARGRRSAGLLGAVGSCLSAVCRDAARLRGDRFRRMISRKLRSCSPRTCWRSAGVLERYRSCARFARRRNVCNDCRATFPSSSRRNRRDRGSDEQGSGGRGRRSELQAAARSRRVGVGARPAGTQKGLRRSGSTARHSGKSRRSERLQICVGGCVGGQSVRSPLSGTVLPRR